MTRKGGPSTQGEREKIMADGERRLAGLYDPARLWGGKARRQLILKELRLGMSAMNRARDHLQAAHAAGLDTRITPCESVNCLLATTRLLVKTWKAVLDDVEGRVTR